MGARAGAVRWSELLRKDLLCASAKELTSSVTDPTPRVHKRACRKPAPVWTSRATTRS